MHSRILLSLLLVFAVPTFAQVSEEEAAAATKAHLGKYGLDDYMALLTQQYQANLPIKSSALEQTVGVMYLPTNDIQIFRHNTAPNWRELAARIGKTTPTQAAAQMPLRLQTQTVNMACSGKVTRLLLERGLTMRHDYYESDGTALFHTIVTINHCTKPNAAVPNNSFKPNPLRGSAYFRC
jgi:hypothetical protein